MNLIVQKLSKETKWQIFKYVKLKKKKYLEVFFKLEEGEALILISTKCYYAVDVNIQLINKINLHCYSL